MIDVGFVISAFVPLVLYWIFGENHLRAVWRISLGLGIIPAVLVFIWRLNMDEPTRFKRDSMKRIKTPYLLIIRRYWSQFLGICITWFIYDFITYPVSTQRSLEHCFGRLTVYTVWFVLVDGRRQHHTQLDSAKCRVWVERCYQVR